MGNLMGLANANTIMEICTKDTSKMAKNLDSEDMCTKMEDIKKVIGPRTLNTVWGNSNKAIMPMLNTAFLCMIN